MEDFNANHLLASLGEKAATIQGLMTRVDIPRNFQINAAKEKVEYVYFPTGGIVSTIASMKGRQVEIGIVGWEGMSSPLLGYGIDMPPWESVMQVPGPAWRIAADDLRAVFAESPAVRELMLKFAYCFSIQVSETAFTNGLFGLERRLARWLVMCHDRLGGDEVTITHEYLAVMLAVRRPAVTLAIQVLEGELLVRANRAKITIRDRGGLIARAGEAYGTAEQEYMRVLGVR